MCHGDLELVEGLVQRIEKKRDNKKGKYQKSWKERSCGE